MLTHVSATSIKLFKSCPRRWFERYVLDKREPSSKAMIRGNKVHEYLEEYLLSGQFPDDTDEGLIAQAGLHHLPTLTGEYHVEISLAELPIDDTPAPFKGFIDLYVVGDTPEILDHKTTSNFKYALTAEQLAEDTQLIIYAAHALNNCDAREIRLTHVCYLTKPPYKSQRTSTLVSRAHVEERFSAILETVKAMVAACELPAATMLKNKDHCWAYGKRCPYFDDCQRTINHKGIKNMSDKQLAVIDRLRGVKTSDVKTSDVKTSDVKTSDAHLYVNCVPLGVTLTPLSDGLKPLIDKVCTSKGVEHISLIPYAQGYDLLSTLIMNEGLPAGHYFAHSRSPLYEKCCDALHSAAPKVVIGQ